MSARTSLHVMYSTYSYSYTVNINSVGPNPFMGSGFSEGSIQVDTFVVRFWYMNLGLEGFEVPFFQIWAKDQPFSG